MEMAEKIRNVSDVCKAKKALDMCALDFKDTVKKLFGLDIMLDWGMEECKFSGFDGFEIFSTHAFCLFKMGCFEIFFKSNKYKKYFINSNNEF